MDLQTRVSAVILQPKNDQLDYKAVLPPSKSIAQTICSFSNTDGGLLILGVSEIGGLKIAGLSEDFRATTITHKAIDLLSPRPLVDYGYVQQNGKKLFAIYVEKSSVQISLEGRIFIRKNAKTVDLNASTEILQPSNEPKIRSVNTSLESLKAVSTDSKIRLIEHYQSVLKMADSMKALLFPEGLQIISKTKEGRVLARILFSSIVDNFETYLSDILFEIYLAKPETLKSEQTVKVEDVLNCSDIQEFITFWAKQKISKLQKGSVKGFVKENQQIKDLNVIDNSIQEEIEKILQIRHLYAHRNGIADDKFMKYFPAQGYGIEHQMPIEEILDKIVYLADIVDKLDIASITKYSLSAG